jgi:hypothetical protein
MTYYSKEQVLNLLKILNSIAVQTIQLKKLKVGLITLLSIKTIKSSLYCSFQTKEMVKLLREESEIQNRIRQELVGSALILPEISRITDLIMLTKWAFIKAYKILAKYFTEHTYVYGGISLLMVIFYRQALRNLIKNFIYFLSNKLKK